MNVALFGKSIASHDAPFIQVFLDRLASTGDRVFIYDAFYQSIKTSVTFPVPPVVYSTQAEVTGHIDYLFSIGGDGTLLDTITLVGNSGIPVIGINMGRLGFLSTISKEEIVPALEQIRQKKYFIDQRTLLRLTTPNQLFANFNYALNDLSVYKIMPNSMLAISVYIDKEFLNTYWADGLIVATPTGSTAYSLSCTGPIITPHSRNFVITPIASHNLTVRPIVIPDDSTIRIKVEGRGINFFVGLDSRIETIENSIELTVNKEDFRINLLRMSDNNFFKTIREKLKWGLDIRN